MMHPTRTNLLLLRERIRVVSDSVALLKGRRQALLREFLLASAPLLQAREKLADPALDQAAALSHRGEHRQGGIDGERQRGGVAAL